MAPTIEIVNLGEFTAAVRKAVVGADAALHKGLEAAGKPVLSRAQELSPSRRVAAAGRLQVSGAEGQIVFEKDWAEAAEWSRKPGWMAHGAPGRYGHRALREKGAEVDKLVDQQMAEIVTMYGWFG
jgi:hypothetical protein